MSTAMIASKLQSHFGHKAIYLEPHDGGLLFFLCAECDTMSGSTVLTSKSGTVRWVMSAH